MGLPAKLTHEEQALLNKFALLKKKRKTPSQKNPSTVNHDSNTPISPVKKEFSSAKKSPLKEPPVNPKDAKEKAKQLLAAGRLKINKETENRSFKRAKAPNSERKINKPNLIEEAFSNKNQARHIDNIKKDSYSNFVTGNKEADSNDEQKPKRDFKRQNSNLFITGYGLTKQIMDACFPEYGPIKNIYYDPDKGHGYVTYQRPDSAEKAIAELHGEMKQGVTLKVVYARKRTYDDNRFTYRPRNNPKHDDDVSEDFRAQSKPVDSPTKAPPSREKRKLLKYAEPDQFDF